MKKKSDHRKIGRQLDLFCFSDLVGPGLPLFGPNGSVIIDELKKHIEAICYKYGFRRVYTPHIAKIKLYELSGHAKKFPEELFHVKSKGRWEDFVMKPVQCPHQAQIFASRPRSYRDLPIRYMESEKQYRAEKPGEVGGGLNRVLAITVEDGHSFCRVDQVKDEVKKMIKIINEFYSALGLLGNYWVSLSVRDYKHPEKYIGDMKDWDKCEEILEEVSNEMKLNAKRCEGEAAVYGPKIDFMFKDAQGREIQIPTIQVDFASPKRFGLAYINKNGKKVPPVMVHRAILGSYERFLVLLIEHFQGAFPLWLSPVQVVILPISERHVKYAEKIAKRFERNNIRFEINDRAVPLSSRIRNSEMQKIPYMIIVGDKEIKGNSISIRKRGSKRIAKMKINEFLKDVKKKTKMKDIDL